MRRQLLIIVLLCLVGGVIPPICGAETIDDLPEVMSEYARGKRLMREGDWLGASRSFEQLAGRFPQSPNRDLFLFNRAKSQYHFGNYPEALAGFSSFIRRYPDSPLLAHAYFFQGNVLYLRGQLDGAVASYVTAYQRCKDTRLADLLVASLSAAVAGAKSVSLGPADFEGLSPAKKCRLVEPVAEALVGKGQYAAAGRLLALCGKELDVMPESSENLQTRGLEVAVLLPFSGELQTFGEQIYQGITIGAEEYRQETGRPFTLATFDTKGDPVDAARIVKELLHSNVDAVIGPLTSEAAAVASAALSCGTLPLIAPAATQAGLTMLSESAFQLSPNIELQGVRMAEYAVLNLGADSAAIITSTSTDHLQMSRAFARRFEALGGTVTAIEYYRSRDKDFGEYIQDVKAVLLGVHPDSAFFVNEMGDTLDADGIPARVDCLYMPGKASQLRLLIPQVNFYNLNAEYLGSDGWADPAVYKLGDQVTKSAVFPSPFLQKRDSEVYLRFSSAFDRRYGGQPDRLACLGYDAVSVLRLAMAGGAVSRDDLAAHLASVRGMVGAAATVSFGEHRENTEMPLYQIRDGAAVYLGDSQSAPDSDTP
ncbi:MAG: penicillin-binding protein activator [candidate division Zixibacteria bacterium]|nr:penicillin-binding protein activator [candidate division Zixibacteria bacterium]